MAMTRGRPDGPVDHVGDDERYRVRSGMEIASLLRAVAAHREIVTVQFGGPDAFVVSAVLDVDAARRLVVMDYGADAAAMQRLLHSDRLRVSTQLDHVRIAFTADAAAAATFEGGPAFVLALPASVLRMQRRDAYRLKLPMGRPLQCEIPDAARPGVRHAVRVRDIGVAGIGLVEYPKDMPVAMGMVWPGCSIVLPELGTVVVDLEVMHAADGDTRRCGCRFRNVALPMTNLIQRYITRVEREQHAVR